LISQNQSEVRISQKVFLSLLHSSKPHSFSPSAVQRDVGTGGFERSVEVTSRTMLITSWTHCGAPGGGTSKWVKLGTVGKRNMGKTGEKQFFQIDVNHDVLCLNDVLNTF
jgi:hypothetical protein